MPSPAIPAVPAVSVPTRLRLPDLLHITDRFADEVLSGRFAELLPPADSRLTPAGSPGCTPTTNWTCG